MTFSEYYFLSGAFLYFVKTVLTYLQSLEMWISFGNVCWENT